nr:hypothetical protein [Tanacetum cinerariifolium]
GELFGISGKDNVSQMISKDTLIICIKLFYGSAWRYIKDRPTVVSQGVIRQLRLGACLCWGEVEKSMGSRVRVVESSRSGGKWWERCWRENRLLVNSACRLNVGKISIFGDFTSLVPELARD